MRPDRDRSRDRSSGRADIGEYFRGRLGRDENDGPYGHDDGDGPGGLPPSTSASAHGLALLLSLNASQLTPGQALNVSISLTNTPATTNNLTADGGAWAGLPDVSLGPCGDLNRGFGFLIAQGFYTASNASSAVPLALYAPGIYNCPAVLQFSCYLFQPYSYLAGLCGSGEGSCIRFPAAYSGAVQGSWGADGGSPGTFAVFKPGVYTVLAEAEWGQVDALHFTVT
jgi:hypothetical protein